MIVNANALHIPLADGCVHTIVTSPPYYGLRNYGVGGQIGLEVTPDAYIANLVEVFRECKRILRDDGTLWVNIGDSYFSDTKGTGGPTPKQASNTGSFYEPRKFERTNHMKPKDLIGIPWMLAFALRADGWYLRQDIIWAKPNPMPESVKDRCTKSHEYIFLLSKSAKYYYDNEAVMDDAVTNLPIVKKSGGGRGSAILHNSDLGKDPYGSMGYSGGGGKRNKRDVWTVTTKPYKGAHYATFNPELIKPCILAGAPETCCAKCGAPYVRVMEIVEKGHSDYDGSARAVAMGHTAIGPTSRGAITPDRKQTTGFQPTCTCNAGTSSGIVFDPFVGSGTTVATAIQLGRKGIGLDLSYKYLQENAKVRVEAAELPLLNLIEQY